MLEIVLPPDQDQRDLAIDTFDRNVFLAAGAGTGKTKVLVDRYREMLRRDLAEVPEIVAITFAEKAASEMRGRIRSKCSEQIENAESDQDRRKWERHLRDIENAPISTIHSLCARLLRENPVAAAIDPEFSVLDQTERNMMLREHVEHYMLKRLCESPPDQAHELALLAGEFGIGTLTNTFVAALSDSELCEQWILPETTETELVERWRTQCEAASLASLGALLADTAVKDAFTTVLQTPPTNEADKLASIRASILNAVRLLSAADRPTESRLSAAVEIAQMSAVNVGSKDNWASKEVLKDLQIEMRLLRERFSPFKELGQDDASAESVHQCAELTAALISELRLAYEQFREKKRSGSLLDFDDLQLQTRDVLLNHPDVRRRYQDRFKQVMVDEFQDTNRLQKQIAWMLAGSSDGAQAAAPGRLFVVGDVKQSIYRFRGADVTVFNQVRREFARSDQCVVLELTTNFRTQAPLLGLFNEVFGNDDVMGRNPDRPDHEAYYEDLEAFPSRPSTVVPPARLRILQSSSQLEEPQEEDDASGASLEELREAEGNAIAKYIQQLMEAKPQVYDHDQKSLRELNYGDIVLLFRSMTDLHLYERALRLAEIPYYVKAGRGYYQRLEVLDLVSVLKHLENPTDAFTLACVLRSPCVAISDATLYWLSTGKGLIANYDAVSNGDAQPPFDPIPEEERSKLHFSLRTFGQLRQIKNRVSIARLIEEVLEQTGLSAVLLTQFNGERAVANLRKLAELARDVEQSGLFSLQDFIRHLDSLRLAEERESEAAVHEEADDVVQILTVHSAKGSQWPIVILPDLRRETAGRSGVSVLLSRTFGVICPAMDSNGKKTFPGPISWIQREEQKRELAEKRRLLYVAMTRAGDHLLMSATSKESRSGKSDSKSWLAWLTAAMNLDPNDPLPVSALPECPAQVWSAAEIQPPPRAGRDTHTLAKDLESALRSAAPTRANESFEDLKRSISPICPDASQRRAFSVAQLRDYLTCPHRFQLARVMGLAGAPALEIVAGDGNPLSTGSASAAARGTLIHRLLQHVALAPGEDPETLIESALAGIEAPLEFLTEPGRGALRQTVIRFLQSKVKRWMEDVERQRTELPFTVLVGGVMVDGVFDWIGGDATHWTHLLDYKTGRVITPDKEAEYRFQIGLYCHALRLADTLPFQAGVYYVDRDELADYDPEEIAAESSQRLLDILQQMRAAEFAPIPGSHCRTCPQLWACAAGRQWPDTTVK